MQTTWVSELNFPSFWRKYERITQNMDVLRIMQWHVKSVQLRVSRKAFTAISQLSIENLVEQSIFHFAHLIDLLSRNFLCIYGSPTHI
jgi:hypothetical protein